MGSGKSAVGRQLARLLRLPFHDSDHEIEQRTGVDIPLIFEKEGETGFRARERDIIAELTALDAIVLSTGGGAVLLAENRQHLRERGVVIYLETSVAQQVKRVRTGRQRPLLANVDPASKLEKLMQQREPLYREIADFTFRTDQHRVQGVAAKIVAQLRATSRRSPPS